MNLLEVRKQWEQGLHPLCVLPQDFDGKQHTKVLVVLRNGWRQDSFVSSNVASFNPTGNPFHCYRYFLIEETWQVSVDRQNVFLEDVWSWLSVSVCS